MALVSVPSAPKPPNWHAMPSMVDVILSRAAEPWTPIMLGHDELVSVRAGGIVVVMGPTGAGKTSLVATMLVSHARERGPVVVLSRELPADELAARAVGMQCDASWAAVLTGQVPREAMEHALDLPRMLVLDRHAATLSALNVAIDYAKATWPGESILVAIDYVQILESAEKEARAKVADVIAQIDDLARAYGVVVLAISQMSRAASRSARNGESLGADSIDGGAESAAIERAATVTLSIGQAGAIREDGTCAVDLSIGKGRMTGGDQVWPATYCGRSGRWRLAGEARAAHEIRTERQGDRDSAKQRAAELAILAAADRATEPQQRQDLSAVAACSNEIRRAAILALLARGDLVEVRIKAIRSRIWKVWTPKLAALRGVQIVIGPENDCGPSAA